MKASEIANWVECAIGDMAYSDVEMWERNGDYNKKLDELKEAGVVDIGGCHADNMYNDVDTLVDLLADRVYDEAPTDKEKRLALVEDLDEVRGFPAWKEAVERLRERLDF